MSQLINAIKNSLDAEGILVENMSSDDIFCTIGVVPIAYHINHLNRGIHIIRSRVLLRTGEELDFACFAAGAAMGETFFTRIYSAALPEVAKRPPFIGQTILEVVGYYQADDEFLKKVKGLTNDVISGYKAFSGALDHFRSSRT